MPRYGAPRQIDVHCGRVGGRECLPPAVSSWARSASPWWRTSVASCAGLATEGSMFTTGLHLPGTDVALIFLIYLQAVQDKTHPPPTCRRPRKFFSACVQLFSFLNWKFFKNAQFSWTLCIWIWDRPYNWPLTSLYLSLHYSSRDVVLHLHIKDRPLPSPPLCPSNVPVTPAVWLRIATYSGLVHTAFLTLLAKPSFSYDADRRCYLATRIASHLSAWIPGKQ